MPPSPHPLPAGQLGDLSDSVCQRSGRFVGSKIQDPADCAQFCAHHQTLPSVTECRSIAGKPCWTRNLSHSVTTGHIPSKLLVLRAATATNQKVGSSNLSGRTILIK